jgi:predicted GIY-YIG superfamily endonuclease
LFDKETGFALLYENEAKKKLEEQIKNKSKIIDYDPTPTFTTKFQKLLCKLRKEGKLNTSTYFKMYPSDCVPPRIYGMVKAHKPEKNYPMRPVVSTINTPPYGTSEYLVKIIQPTLNKNKTRLINSSDFVNDAKLWKIDPNEIQASFDVVNLYPSVPINEAIPVIVDILNADVEDLITRTKLTLVDIHQLIELSLSKCYFLYENKIRILPNSGPIGLSLMVVIAEAFLQNIEKRALNLAFFNSFQPITYKRYVDDTHARFDSIENLEMFLKTLNEQNPSIQYTVELENQKKQINFLDICVTNTMKGFYEFQIHRKDAITNVQIKPNSNINPSIITGVFKGFLCRAKRICSEKHLTHEIDFLINIFFENGYNKSELIKIAKNYLDRVQKIPTTQESDKHQFVKLPWIPIIGPKLRREFRKQNIRVIFTSAPNLNNILCNNKTKLPPNSHPGVYQLKCSCGSIYIGETKKKVISRSVEHQRACKNEKWTSSGATEHSKTCQGTFDWLNPKTLAVNAEYRSRKIRESLEINKAKVKHEMGSGEVVLNRDDGDNVKTRTWGTFFTKF